MKTILWDFDGVILDSMKIRDWGFEEIFKFFDKDKVSLLLEYHRKNGGLSRYVKIRYFFEVILGKNINEYELQKYANQFSLLMRDKLVNPKNLIQESLNFIKENHKKYNFHIVSGSDQNELQFLCKELKINHFFISINGSPVPKNDLVKRILKSFNYNKNETLLIGDSINDYNASKVNNIFFLAYNNQNLNKYNNINPLF